MKKKIIKIRQYNYNKDFEKALKLISSIENLQNIPLSEEFIFEKARAFIGVLNYKKAKICLKNILKKNIQNIEALNLLIDLSSNVRDYEFVIKISKSLGRIDNICLMAKRLISKMSEYNQKNKGYKVAYIYKILNKIYEFLDLKTQNIILNEYEISQKKIFLDSKPRFLHVVLTTKCNLNCVMCLQHNKNWDLPDEAYNEIFELIKFAEFITWQGGEVFLYKKFLKLFYEAIKYNCEQTILTNGLLLTKDFIDVIVQNKVCLSISIDAVDKKIYESIRVGASFDKLIDKLNYIKYAREKYRNNNFSIIIAVVVMKQNLNHLGDIVNFAIKYGFNAILFQYCQESNKNKDSCVLNDNEKEKASLFINNIRENREITKLLDIRGNL